jgi:hypothetical protein
MRKRKKNLRDRVIIIRATKIEKKLADELSKDFKYNTSAMFRQLIRDAKEGKYAELPGQIMEQEKLVLNELTELLGVLKATTSR